MITITQSVDLSLTESLVPTVIHVKQFDAMARQIKCSIYNGSELVTWTPTPSSTCLAHALTELFFSTDQTQIRTL